KENQTQADRAAPGKPIPSGGAVQAEPGFQRGATGAQVSHDGDTGDQRDRGRTDESVWRPVQLVRAADLRSRGPELERVGCHFAAARAGHGSISVAARRVGAERKTHSAQRQLHPRYFGTAGNLRRSAAAAVSEGLSL